MIKLLCFSANDELMDITTRITKKTNTNVNKHNRHKININEKRK